MLHNACVLIDMDGEGDCNSVDRKTWRSSTKGADDHNLSLRAIVLLSRILLICVDAKSTGKCTGSSGK